MNRKTRLITRKDMADAILHAGHSYSQTLRILQYVSSDNRDNRILSPGEVKQIKNIVALLALNFPLAYITGYQHFYNLTLQVKPGIFIPRWDTECIVEAILHRCAHLSNLQVLDLGTGAGTIALSLGYARQDWQVIATDINDTALDIARSNARQNKIWNVNFVHSNWFKNVTGTFDIIVSNPPYIDIQEQVDSQVLYEPAVALYADHQGLKSLVTIIQNSKQHLKEQGILFLEHGYAQGEQVKSFLDICGYHNIERIYDIEHRWRGSIGYIEKNRRS